MSFSAARVDEAGNQIEDRGLSGPVGTDESEEFSRIYGQIQVGDGHQTAELAVQAFYFEHPYGRFYPGFRHLATFLFSF
jgi:hypothetical protein